jgi:GntR family transcriptional regulator
MEVPVRNAPLADQVFKILIDRIAEHAYPPGTQLPSEHDLANELNVSRSTVRTAIFKLEDRKMVYRKPGVGTYVTENINISNPLNEFIVFSKLIEENGFQPGYIHISSEIITSEENYRKGLQLSKDQKILKIKKVFTANEDPIIYVINYIPTWVFEKKVSIEESLHPEFTKRFKYLFDVVCNQQVSYFVSKVSADLFENINPPDVMNIYQPQTPTLIIDQIGYDIGDRPIFSSIEYHPGNWMTFNLIRRWEP